LERSVAVTVSVPTILRTHTDGAKSVDAAGSTLAQVIDDLDAHHSGLKGRLVDDGKLHRYVNVYVNDEDVRFSGGLDTAIADGDDVTILPAVAGGSAPCAPVAGGSVASTRSSSVS